MASLISLRNAQILIIAISVINLNQFALSSNPNLYTQKEIQALEKVQKWYSILKATKMVFDIRKVEYVS